MSEIERALREGRPSAAGVEAAVQRFISRAQEQGLIDLAYAEVDSPFGPLLVAVSSRGLVRLAYPNEPPERVVEELARRISPRVLKSPSSTDEVRRELTEYFQGSRRRFEVPIDWALTQGFGRRVLRATARVPFGRITTYREVATRAGSPRAYRAAGNALGANPIPIVVPCHRVLHSGGGLGGYTGGLERKEFLLELEGALR
jgi:methylated-DNA-[protein]-cysteine S-methyltransferase